METINDKKLAERLDKHPFLKEYFEHFADTFGESERGDYLPNLTIWFRRMFSACGVGDGDVPCQCGWDDETAEDFWSWGHNSRWANTFWAWLVNADLEEILSVAFDTMDEYGKPDFDCDVLENQKEVV